MFIPHYKKKESKNSLKSFYKLLFHPTVFYEVSLIFFIPLLISFLLKDTPSEKQDILYRGQNRLVKQGLILKNLSEIFLPIFLPSSEREKGEL